MDKAPAFQLYARDWVTDEQVSRMSDAAQGLYVRLLCYQWLEGSLPREVRDISATVGRNPRSISAVWQDLEPMFPLFGDETRRANPRLAEQRNRLESKRLAQSAGGRNSQRKQQATSQVTCQVTTQVEGQGTTQVPTKSAVAVATAVQEPTVENPEWPPWVEPILDDWISVHGLPTRTKPEKCRKVFYDLQHLDHNDPGEIARVCAWIVRNKVPTYIKSPMKLRKPNGDDDCQTFEMYAEMSLNGSPKASTDGRDYLRETAQ